MKAAMPFTINASDLTVIAHLRFPSDQVLAIWRLDKRLLAKCAIEKAEGL